ncbi:MAG: hypothetical protein NTV75_00545 [Bacteroidia bacterium]|jgi:hypothetical protein|nr:hypothetical protein [Bacteroidia bacterium]
MNFVGNVLRDVNGIQAFYTIGLLIFLTLFVVILYRTIRMPRKDLVDFKTSIFEVDELNQKDQN